MAGEAVEKITGEYLQGFVTGVLHPRASMVLGYGAKNLTFHVQSWKQVGSEGTEHVFSCSRDQKAYKKAIQEARGKEDFGQAHELGQEILKEWEGCLGAYQKAFPSDKRHDFDKEWNELSEDANFLRNPSEEETKKLLERHKARREKEFEDYKHTYTLASIDIAPGPYPHGNRLQIHASHARSVLFRLYPSPKRQFVLPTISIWVSGKPDSLRFDIYRSEVVKPQVEKDAHCKDMFVEEAGVSKLYEVRCESGNWRNLEVFGAMGFDVRRDDRPTLKLPEGGEFEPIPDDHLF